jgi:hypothetical protein
VLGLRTRGFKFANGAVFRQNPTHMGLIVAALICLGSISAAFAGEEVDPPPYTRALGLNVPLTLGGSLTDMVFTTSNEYLNSSASFDTGFDWVFSRIVEWNIVDVGVAGSTGSIETAQSFRQYGVFSLSSTPSFNIPLGSFGTTVLHVYGGFGYAKSFAASFANTPLPTQSTGEGIVGAEFAGNFSGLSHHWRWEGFGLTYTKYFANSPVSSVLNLIIHVKVSYDLVLSHAAVKSSSEKNNLRP